MLPVLAMLRDAAEAVAASAMVESVVKCMMKVVSK